MRRFKGRRIFHQTLELEMSDQHSPDQSKPDEHTREGQIQRAKRLREQIEGLKSGGSNQAPHGEKSLREQIEDRAGKIRQQEESPER